jgi:hypothetical protein
MLNPQLIRHHRDELAVRRLRFVGVDRVAEDVADAVDVAACPGDFDRVADRTFNAGWRRFVAFGDCRVQRLRDSAFLCNIFNFPIFIGFEIKSLLLNLLSFIL